MDPAAFAASVSATDPDWSRERIRRFWDPGPKLIRAIRRWQAARARAQGRGSPLARIAMRYWSLNHLWWSTITQCELHLTCEIGGGLFLPHPQGLIVAPSARIGPNCLLMHQVTLTGGVVLGGHCDVGAGARLIGPLTVGEHVQIGANAVVTRDVPARCTTGGIPARVIRGPVPDPGAAPPPR